MHFLVLIFIFKEYSIKMMFILVTEEVFVFFGFFFFLHFLKFYTSNECLLLSSTSQGPDLNPFSSQRIHCVAQLRCLQ